MFREFKQVAFHGASGNVVFDPNTAERLKSSVSYTLINWQLEPADGASQEVVEKVTMSIALGDTPDSIAELPGAELWWPGGARGLANRPVDVTTLPWVCGVGFLVQTLPGGVQTCEPCSEGTFYSPATSSTAASCTPCFWGTICVGNTTRTLETLPLEPGYW